MSRMWKKILLIITADNLTKKLRLFYIDDALEFVQKVYNIGLNVMENISCNKDQNKFKSSFKDAMYSHQS